MEQLIYICQNGVVTCNPTKIHNWFIPFPDINWDLSGILPDYCSAWWRYRLETWRPAAVTLLILPINPAKHVSSTCGRIIGHSVRAESRRGCAMVTTWLWHGYGMIWHGCAMVATWLFIVGTRLLHITGDAYKSGLALLVILGVKL